MITDAPFSIFLRELISFGMIWFDCYMRSFFYAFILSEPWSMLGDSHLTKDMSFVLWSHSEGGNATYDTIGLICLSFLIDDLWLMNYLISLVWIQSMIRSDVNEEIIGFNQIKALTKASWRKKLWSLSWSLFDFGDMENKNDYFEVD